MKQKSVAENTDSFRPIIGIDLGTTNSAAAYIYQRKPKMIPMANGEHTLPSVVLINPSGKVVVGEDARGALIAMPERTKAAVKRDMGEEITISLGDQSYSPEEVSAFILKEIKTAVDAHLGEGEKEAVITVPAYFTNQQRQATKTAGELAGFVVERIINEPTAAALAFGMQHLDENSHILVYDLGGGTFDVSIVEMMDGILEVKASAGNARLGGEDFDWLIVDWLAEQIIKEHNVDPRENIRARNRLKEEAEQVKKKLSAQDFAAISIPVVVVKENTPIGLDTTLTRREFVKLIEPLLNETRDKLVQVLEDAHLQRGDIDEILLVGGSTRIPQVRKLVTDFFGKAPKDGLHPDEAVALGAAVQAGLKSGALADSGLIVTDVAPFSMGIAVLAERGSRVKPGAFQAIIPRNTTIPVTRTERFWTTHDNQTAVQIEIYQGENEWVKNNFYLNEFLLEGLPKGPAGTEAVDVTFRYNLNGLLEVTAKSVSTGKEMTVTLEDALDRSSEEAFESSLAKVETAYAGDEEMIDELDLFDFLDQDEADDQAEQSESFNKLIEEAQAWHARLSAAAEKLSGRKKDKLQQILAALEVALDIKEPYSLEKSIEKAIDLAIDLEL